MYKITIKNNEAFGIDGYSVPIDHFDYMKIVKAKEYQKQKKGEKFKGHLIKRGHFLEDLIKMKKFVPGPQYNVLPPLPDLKKIGQIEKKKKEHGNKKSFLDEITNSTKFVPGVGAYNVIKTDEQIKKEVNDLKNKNKKFSYIFTFLKAIFNN